MRPSLVLMLLGMLWGCQAGPSDPSEVKSKLYKVPTSIILSGESFELTAFLWRDFQPISPPDGKPLMVVVSLPDHLTDVSVHHLWVLFGNQIWSADVEQIPGTQQWRADGGPKWGPEVLVDVVVQLSDRNGKQFFVRALDQPIGRAS